MKQPAPDRRQAAAQRRRDAVLPREVRIVGGLWRGSRLPVADRPGLRPTPDRVRETLFNWLGQDLTGWRCLDAFAGTGALGFEAASRGAARVVLLERDAQVAASLEATRARLGGTAVQVIRADAIGWMSAQPPQSFDLVFLDPPFGSGLGLQALERAGALLAEGGLVYAESPAELAADGLPTGWERLRHTRAGSVHAHVLRLHCPREHPAVPTRNEP